MGPEQIATHFAERGHLMYDGEGITQLQHGWQCARMARLAGAVPELQLAAWLHDLGHLMTALDGTPTARGIDDVHEALGSRAVADSFGPAVAEPIALHVLAKRCLVSTTPRYQESLSPDSLRSLSLQGGPMSDLEVDAFMARPHARDALRLRRWDDHAKAGELHPASAGQALAELRELMQLVLRNRPA